MVTGEFKKHKWKFKIKKYYKLYNFCPGYFITKGKYKLILW
jgi:hypothetical protein